MGLSLRAPTGVSSDKAATRTLCCALRPAAAAGKESRQLSAALAEARQQLQLGHQQQERSAQQAAEAAAQLATAQQECAALRATVAAQERDFRAALERNTALLQAEMAHMQAVVQVGRLAVVGAAAAPCRIPAHGTGCVVRAASRARAAEC